MYIICDTFAPLLYLVITLMHVYVSMYSYVVFLFYINYFKSIICLNPFITTKNLYIGISKCDYV